MRNFEVIIREIEIYTVDVEADSEEEAIYKAYEAIETDEGRRKHHDDSFSEEEAFEECCAPDELICRGT